MLTQLNKMLDEVQVIDVEKNPHAMKFIHIPREFWEKEKRNILREILKRPDIAIEINGWMGGGYRPEEHILRISPEKGLRAIPDEEMERYIDDFVSMEIKE